MNSQQVILKVYPEPNLDKTLALLKLLFPGEGLERVDDGDLSFTCPPNNLIYAGCFDGISVVAAKEFGRDKPSKIDQRFIAASNYRCVYLHAMHSVVDWFAFAKWESGKLIRSLSLSADSKIIEDVGERLNFENPYCNGDHSLLDAGNDGDEEYPFKFHPLDLGEEALKAFFGYQLEGAISEDLIEPEKIKLFGFKRVKPWWKIW